MTAAFNPNPNYSQSFVGDYVLQTQLLGLVCDSAYCLTPENGLTHGRSIVYEPILLSVNRTQVEK